MKLPFSGRGIAGSTLTCTVLEAEDTERKAGEMINCHVSPRINGENERKLVGDEALEGFLGRTNRESSRYVTASRRNFPG